MQGVTILNTINEYGHLVSPYIPLILCGVALLICICGMLTTQWDGVQATLIALIVVVFIGIIGSTIGVFIKTDEVTGVIYEVTVSEDVSMTEFYEKYDVVDNEDMIFTVKERAK